MYAPPVSTIAPTSLTSRTENKTSHIGHRSPPQRTMTDPIALFSRLHAKVVRCKALILRAARADFWRIAIPLAPFVAAAVPFFATLLLGGFNDFQIVGRDVSALEAFGILGTMCFPFAAYHLADRTHKEAMNAAARSWPTASGVIRSSAVERRMTGWASALWALDVRYDYSVDGRTHTATTLGFAARFVADKKTTINASLRFHRTPSCLPLQRPTDKLRQRSTAFTLSSLTKWKRRSS